MPSFQSYLVITVRPDNMMSDDHKLPIHPLILIRFNVFMMAPHA